TKGLVERIGLKDSIFTIEVNGEKIKEVQDIKDHEQAVNMMLESLQKHGVINDINEIDGTGHRVVHGGELFPESALVTDDV
ncbi:acetate kinase, partial [Staphylococcus pseudintermedius]